MEVENIKCKRVEVLEKGGLLGAVARVLFIMCVWQWCGDQATVPKKKIHL